MWAKLSNVLKHRPIVDESEAPSPEITSTVQEKHPNVSASHNNDDGESKPEEVPFPVPSPPSSPSRHRNGVFRRMSRSAKHDSGEPSKASSALKLPLRLPKKVKSHISLHTNSRCIPTCDSFYHLPGDHSVSGFCQHYARFCSSFANGRHETINGELDASRDTHGQQIQLSPVHPPRP
jgi:hypothetical protein